MSLARLLLGSCGTFHNELFRTVSLRLATLRMNRRVHPVRSLFTFVASSLLPEDIFIKFALVKVTNLTATTCAVGAPTSGPASGLAALNSRRLTPNEPDSHLTYTRHAHPAWARVDLHPLWSRRCRRWRMVDPELRLSPPAVRWVACHHCNRLTYSDQDPCSGSYCVTQGPQNQTARTVQTWRKLICCGSRPICVRTMSNSGHRHRSRGVINEVQHSIVAAARCVRGSQGWPERFANTLWILKQGTGDEFVRRMRDFLGEHVR